MTVFKKISAAFLGMCVLVSMSACKKADETEATSTTTQETSTETTTEKTEDPSEESEEETSATNAIIAGEGELLGMTNWSYQLVDMGDYQYWAIFDEDGREFAQQYVYMGDKKPRIWTKDFDGDGQEEFVVNTFYTADGGQAVWVYKLIDGEIKIGTVDVDTYMIRVLKQKEFMYNAARSYYDEEKGELIFCYDFGEEYVLSLDDFIFGDIEY
ncbi:MAG: hypothetical protein J6Y08_00535 [Clostridiales bacterium]|nr:hypothetical protein [Clostridiales bacterium]